MTVEAGKVKLYCCGGLGINVGSQLEQFRGGNETATATLDIVYTDTSKSNFNRNADRINIEHAYVIDGVDGSGKVRSENYEAITQHIKDLIHTHKPGDLNIVLSSASGGSGSVLNPSIVSEFMERDVPTVVIIVGSTNSKLDIKNTINTIKSFESISKKKKKPIVSIYRQNSEDTPRGQVDKEIINLIIMLCVLFSRQNHELDSQDLYNWLNYNRVTSFQPQLAALDVFISGQEINLSSLGNIISTATILGDESQADPFTNRLIPEYACSGVLPNTAADSFKDKVPYCYAITDGVYVDTVNKLSKQLAELDEIQQSRIVKRNIISSDDIATDTGLIL